MKNARVYLDYAAATPLDERVADVMSKSQASFANPSAMYQSARLANENLVEAHKLVGMFLGANSDEIVFTSGATESNNLAILGSARAVGNGHIVSIATEHTSVRGPLKQLEAEGFTVTNCPIDQTGLVDLDEFSKCLQEDTILVTISYANSEIGTIQPLSKINAIIREHEKKYNKQILFHSDASAAALLLSCDVSRLGVNMLTISGAKLYGPKSVGAIYIKRGTKLQPLIFGGGQQHGLRAGTEDINQVTGLAEALRIVQESRHQDEVKFESLYKCLIDGIQTQLKPTVTGHSSKRLHNVVSVIFDGLNGEDLVAYLDAAGYEVSTGAACEASSDKPSQALLALGYSEKQAQGSLRVSFGRQTSISQVKDFARELAGVVKRLSSKQDLPDSSQV